MPKKFTNEFASGLKDKMAGKIKDKIVLKNLNINHFIETAMSLKNHISKLEMLFPFLNESKKLTNKKISESLQSSFYLASKNEIKHLEKRIDKLEKNILDLKSSLDKISFQNASINKEPSKI